MEREQSLLRDRDIREPLFEFLEETFGKIRILEEKTMGLSRADVVMITPTDLYGIEIKSDADTYARLASQVKDYDKYYDYNFAVVGTSHAAHIHEHVPAHWGIITVEIVDGEPDFYIFRRAMENPKVTWEKKLQILWRPELARIQEKNSMPKYKEKSKLFVANKIAERIEKGKLDQTLLKQQISEELFERDYSSIKEELAAYRKGEIQKQLEKETDLETRMQLMMRREMAKANLKTRGKRRRRLRK